MLSGHLLILLLPSIFPVHSRRSSVPITVHLSYRIFLPLSGPITEPLTKQFDFLFR
jgi:hypothetical protein